MADGYTLAKAYVQIAPSMEGVAAGVRKEFGQVEREAANTGKRMGGLLSGALKATSAAATAVVSAAGVGLGVALTKGLGRLNAIDSAKAKLRGLGNDADSVKTIMQNATKAVEGTAYGLDAAATVAAGAVAAGIKPGEKLQSTLKTVANSAAAAGVSMDEMGTIFNKAATQASGVQNDVIGQLADKGLPIYQALADQMGVTAGEVFKMASQGKIDFETFSAAAEKAAGTVADEMGKTLPGAIQNLMAAVGRIGANLWKGLELDDGTYTGIYGKLAALVESIRKALGPVEKIASKVGDALGGKLGPIIDGLTGIFNKLGDAGGGLTKSLGSISAALGPAVAAFGMLGIGGLAPLLAKLGPLSGLLGPLPKMLGALGGPAGVAGAALFALAKVDPTQMAAGFTQITAKVPEIFQKITETVVHFAMTVVPSLVDGLVANLPVLVRGISTMIGTLIQSMTTFVPRILHAAIQLFTGLVDALGQMVPVLVTGLQLLLQQIVGQLPTFIPMLIQGAISLFNGILDGLLSIVQPLIKAVSDLIPVVIDTIATALPQLINGAITLFMGLVDGLIMIIPELLALGYTIVPKLLTSVMKMLPVLIGGAVQLFMGIVSAIPVIIPQLMTAITGLIPQMVTYLVSAVNTLIEGAITLFMAIVDALPLIIPPLLEAVVGTIGTIIESLIGMIDPLIQGALTMFTAIVDAIPLILPPLITAVIDLIPVIIDSLLGMITTLLEGAVQLFTALIEAIPLILPPLLTAVIELVPLIVTSLIDMLPTLIEGAIDLFMGIVTAIPQILPELIPAVIDLIPKIGQALIDSIPELIQAGKDLIGGLIQGIGDMAGAVVEKVKDLGGQMLGGIKGFFGIKSPSRVMASVGGFLDQGLANGVGGGSAVKASQAMSQQVQAPVNAMQAAFAKAAQVVQVQIRAMMGMIGQLINVMAGTFRTTMSREINAVAMLFQITLPRAVQSAVAAMRSAMGGFSSWTGGAFRSAILSTATAIRVAFSGLPGAIANAWSRMKQGTASPTNFVISSVYMQGIRSAVNAITSAVGLSLDMPSVRRIPGYAQGSAGILPGYTPGRDVHTFIDPKTGAGIKLSGGEAILRPEVARLLGPGTINAWNSSRGRGLSNVGDLGYSAGKVQRFAQGGIFKYLQGNGRVNTGSQSFVSDALDDPRATINALVTGPAKNMASLASGTAWGKASGNAMVGLSRQFEGVFEKKAQALGGAAFVAAARKYRGVPYVWGGSAVPPGLDCSGLVYRALNDIGKNAPRLTAAGYQSVAQSVSQPRRGDLAFWGGPANHVAIMTGANSIVHAPQPGAVVKNAALYGAPSFGRLLYDQGGLIQPGFTLVENRTGKPEPVLSPARWDDLMSGRGGGLREGDQLALVVDGQQMSGHITKVVKALEPTDGEWL